VSRRIGALLLRYLLLIRRDYSRVIDLIYWPFIDIAVWGTFTLFLWRADTQVPNADVWARSVVTIFSSPLSFAEFTASLMLLGVVKVVMALVMMSLIAWLLYAFEVTVFGWALLPFAGNLVLFGWTLGLVALAIVLRYGGRWAILAWSLPFTMMPLCCVFYPLAVLPPGLRALAAALPATHVFEGMRAVLLEGRLSWTHVAWASGLNLVYLGLAAGLVAWVLRVALERGLLPKVR
jgi:ABC-2 type transport system permease protein